MARSVARRGDRTAAPLRCIPELERRSFSSHAGSREASVRARRGRQPQRRSNVYLCEQDAQRALEDCLRDEPQWRDVLYVEEVEFADASLSVN